jgi:hypothetical protein
VPAAKKIKEEIAVKATPTFSFLRGFIHAYEY